MSTERASHILAIWLVANLSIVLLWDLAVLAFNLDTPTVSFYLYQTGRRYPLLYLWVGIGIGHLALPLVLTNGHPR